MGHELYHYIAKNNKQGAKELCDFVLRELRKNKEFNYRETLNEYRRMYEKDGNTKTEEYLVEEIVADSMFDVLNEKSVNRLVKENRTLAEKIKGFIDGLIELFSKSEQFARFSEYFNLDGLEKISDMFFDALSTASENYQKNNTISDDSVNSNDVQAGEDEIKFSLLEDITDSEGNHYGAGVLLDTDLFEGVKTRKWKGVFIKFVTNKLAGRAITVYDKNGNAEKIEFAKNNERVYKDNIKNGHKVINKIAQKNDMVSQLSIIHIDELLTQSSDIGNSTNNSHKWLDENGWEFKTVYVQTINGNIYNVTLNIAKTSDGRKILYDVNRIKKVGTGVFASVPKNGMGSHNLPTFDDTLSQNDNNVNNNISEVEKKYSLSEDSEGNKLSEEQVKRYRNIAPELRDEKGRIKPFYHGTARADRVGNYFNPDRATSGPMAFFTDNAKIAENYSRDKSDTSMAYDSDYDSYETQFRINGKPVADYWYTLSLEEKNELTKKIQQVTMDDDENIILKADNKYGIGNFNDYELNLARGNAIKVLVDGWLNGGTLYGDESRFLEVLETVGIKNAEYKDPNYREEKVYKVYLNVTNPFNTDNADEEFVSDLEDYVAATDMSIYETENSQADMWDKNSVDIYEWIERLKDDIANGTTHAWTSIPDVVTDFLKEYGGYNGIVDKGGKRGGDIHTVVIPFYSNQIKNVDNVNPTDSEDIRYSRNGNIDVDEFNEIGYDVINTTGKKGYKHFKSEVMTWDNTKYLDKVRCGYLGGSFHIYKMLSNETRDILIYKPKSNAAKKDFKTIRSIYNEGKFKTTSDVARLIKAQRDGSNDSSELSRGQRGGHKSVDRFDNRQIREERNSNRGRGSQNDSNDYLSEGKEVEQSIRRSLNNTQSADELIKENAELKEAVEILKQEFKLTEGYRLNSDQIKSMSKGILKRTSSSYDRNTLIENLTKIYDYIANDEQPSYDVAIEAMADLAKAVLSESSVINKDLYNEYEPMRKYFRETAISLSDTAKQELGDFNLFRKENFGRIKFRNDGARLL